MNANHIPSEDFAGADRRRLKQDGPEGYGEVMLSEDLAPFQTPGPAFRGETPAERYEAYAKTLRITVPRLARDHPVQDVILKLGAEGWKDWHLLMAISNLVINFRLERNGEDIKHR